MSKNQSIETKILTGLAEADRQPMDWRALADKLGIPAKQHDNFRAAIKDLHRDGQLLIGERRTIHLPAPGGRMIGRFTANVRGFGFVVPIEPGEMEDLYIPPDSAEGAITGDLVQAVVQRRRFKGKTRTYGRIERIISRGKSQFVGTLFRAASQWMVQTDGRVLHKGIIVDDVGAKQARPGDRVVVRLTEYPEGEAMPRGVLTEVLGVEGEYDAELATVIREFDLSDKFPPKIDKALDKVIDKFNKTVGQQVARGKIPADRLDLRDETIITIDPVDARDFDDAISLKSTHGGYELGVHIADVAFFVKHGSVLDKEAMERGNSVYLPRRVLPMIPEALSNGLCSLQQGQNRLAKSAFITFDAQGNVLGSRFANSIIRSTRRLTYQEATAALEGKSKGIDRKVVGLLKKLEKLARVIKARRERNGMLHLDLREVELEYNEKGEVIDAHPADDSFSHTLIEMFMVEANEAVARLLDSYAIPFIRRIHEDPEPESLQQLRETMTMFGFKLPKNPDRHDLQRAIAKASGKPEMFAVNMTILRSLQKAVYSTRTVGHYALAGEHYAHFTSPIRRYPDLVIHRLLDDHLAGKLKAKAKQLRDNDADMQEVAEHCSFTEQQATNAERQLTATLILQLLSQHVGQTYKGVVNGVASLGVFVQLEKFLIEGLIKVEEFGNDWWQLNTDAGYIEGKNTGMRIKIGDPLDVRIVSADPLSRRLDLTPVETPRSKTNKRKKASKPEKTKKRKAGRRRR